MKPHRSAPGPGPLSGAVPVTARGVALQVLLDCQRREGFVQDVLDAHLTAARLTLADRRLATHLSYGVLRRRGTLDALLAAVCSRPAAQVEPWLWEALRLGAYQLAMLTHVPAHAAVHETVDLAATARPGVRGFLNGVLRACERLLAPDTTDQPGPAALPLEEGRYRRLNRPVLPDPSTRPVEYLTVFSLPEWLAARWHARYSWEECLRLGFWFAAPPPLWLRVNRLRVGRDEVLAALAGAGVAAASGDYPQAIRVLEAAVVRELPGYDQGWFAVQDASAMQVGAALAPEPGWRVLDLCAAPGGKTTHLAELMDDRGEVVAGDVEEERLKTVTELTRRLGLTCVRTVRIDPRQEESIPAGPFDAALVDAPCSNTGVLGRRPEVRWRLQPRELPFLVALQGRLLRAASARVRPGGVVVYSTCSIEPEENEGVVAAAVADEAAGLVLEAETRQVPGRPADGGYWARLRKRA